MVIAIAVIALIFCYFIFALFRLGFYNKNKHNDPHRLPKGEQYEPHEDEMHRLISELESVPFEQVYIHSSDGLRLAARYYHIADGAPLEIEFHGYHGNGVRDFCGGTKLSLNAGRNVLLIDQRAHGLSEGHVISLGIKERFDCVSWVDYAVKRFGSDVKIVLAGISMGAATVLMASDLDLPKNVVGIVSDCAFSSPSGIVKSVFKSAKPSVSALYPLAYLSTLVFGGFKLDSASALSSVARTNIPILFIHGEDDRFVPCQMSYELYDACASKKRVLRVKGAGHALSFIVDKDAYKSAVDSFMKEVLG